MSSSMVLPRSMQDLMATERNSNQAAALFNQQLQQQAYDMRVLHEMSAGGGGGGGLAMPTAGHFMSAMVAPPYGSPRDVEDNIFRLSLHAEAAGGDRGPGTFWQSPGAASANAGGRNKKRSELGPSEQASSGGIDPPKRRHTAPSYSPLDEPPMLDRVPGLTAHEKDLMALAMASGRPPPHAYMPGLPLTFVSPTGCHSSGGGLTSMSNWSPHSAAALFDLNRSMSLMEDPSRQGSQRLLPHDQSYHHNVDPYKSYDYQSFGSGSLMSGGGGSEVGRYSLPPSSRSTDPGESCAGSRGGSGGSPESPDDDIIACENGEDSSANGGTSQLCAVCGDLAAGFHCGAYVCEACKKFFVRCLKQEKGIKFTCSKSRDCVITKDTRTQCQFCRFSKCIALGMYRPGGANISSEISNIPCKVCGSPSSGYHFGAITCEGCKGFFRRTIKERDHMKYQCSRDGKCVIAANTRNICKFCRYHKCLQVGMKPDGSRIGRKPNSVKHATMLELHRIISSRGQDGLPYSLPAGSQSQPVKLEMSSQSSFSDDQSPVSFFRPMELYSRPSAGARSISSYADSEADRLVREASIDMSPRVFDDMHMDSLDMDQVSLSSDSHTQSAATSSACVAYSPSVAHSSSMMRGHSGDLTSPLSHHPSLPAPPIVHPHHPLAPGIFEEPEEPSLQYTKLVSIIDVMRKAAMDLQPILIKSEALVGLINPKMDAAGVWDIMMKQFEHCTMPVLSFAKKLGGFRALPMKKQVNMIQTSMFPIVFLNLSSSYDLERETYNYFCMTPEEENIIMCHFPPFENLIGPFHTVGQIVKALAMDPVEVAFLCSILLTNTTNCEQYADDLIEALRLYCVKERASNGGVCRLGAIMLRLGELARATEAHQRCVVMIANDPGHYGSLPFPQLFQEVHLNHLMESGDIKPVSPPAVTAAN